MTTAAAASVTHYLHRDHLGSVDVVTDQSGQIVQRMSFDAPQAKLGCAKAGKRREITWLTMTDGAGFILGTLLRR